MARALFGLLVVLALLAQVPAASAQLKDNGDDDCSIGELCGSGEVDESQSARDRDVVDPPGDHVTSLITLGLMAAVVGSYLFVALTGRNPFARMMARRRAG